MTVLSLLHHVPGPDGALAVVPAPDAPLITEAMVAALRRRVCPPVVAGEVLPVAWHHGEGLPWSAATDLLEAGDEESAVGLARLLRWCRSRGPAQMRGAWEIKRIDESDGCDPK